MLVAVHSIFFSRGFILRQITFTQIRSFHAVAQEGGFTAASRVLRVGQPTITSQVRALEEYYGIELFFRRGRRVELTPLGQELYAVTTRLDTMEREAEELLDAAGNFRTGSLRIGAVGPYHVTEMLAATHARYPGLELSVQIGNSQAMLKALLDFRVDVAVLSQIKDDSRLWSTTFAKEPLVLFVLKTHPLAQREAVGLEELSGQTLVLREPGSTTRQAFEQALQQAKITPGTIWEIGSREAVWMAVLKGLGLGVVVEQELAPHPDLRVLRFADLDLHTTAHLACLKERRNSRLVRAFLETVLSLSGTPSAPRSTPLPQTG